MSALVRETALERKRLFEMAPHLTEPQWMVVPARRGWNWRSFGLVSASMNAWAPSAERTVMSTGLSRTSLREEPLLNRQAFPFACRYREYLTDDARLVMATCAAQPFRRQVCNRLAVTGLEQDPDGVH